MRLTSGPVERFPKDRDGCVQFRHGDLTWLAEQLGFTSGHIARVISGERPNDAIREQVERLVGVPCARINFPRRRKRHRRQQRQQQTARRRTQLI